MIEPWYSFEVQLLLSTVPTVSCIKEEALKGGTLSYRRLGKFKKVTWDKSLMRFNFVKGESIVCMSTNELR